MEDKNKYIRQFVARAVLVKCNSVLLVNKRGEPHHFLPGGRVEPGESIKQAVVREIKEELNLPCTILQYIGSIEHAFDYYEDTKYYEVSHFFAVDIPTLDPSQKPNSAESELEFRWVSVDELENMDIRPRPVIQLIKDIAANKKFESFWASTLLPK